MILILDGILHQLGRILKAQLFHNVGFVGFNRFCADEKSSANSLFVFPAATNPRTSYSLLVRSLGSFLSVLFNFSWRVKILEYEFHDCIIKKPATTVDGTQCLQNGFLIDIFWEVPIHARLYPG